MTGPQLTDNALTFAVGSVLDPRVLTQEYKINYLRPAGGERLSARALAVSAGRRHAVCRCDVFDVGADGEETLCAAQGTIASVAIPEEAR
jgi:acyl-coenzyme A thioesterase PaaI-like protein